MRILVTGGAGFIGSHLVERLARRGDEVVIVDDFNDYYDPRIKRANASAACAAGDVTPAEGDIRDGAFLADVFAGPAFDCIVHLAARAGVRPSLADPHLYIDVNLHGTLNLLELARDHGAGKFVFASSSSVYGLDPTPFREDSCADQPVSPYGATKRAGEILLSSWRRLYGLKAVALRFFTVYGPRQRPDMAIHKFTRAILAGRPVTMFGDGSSARDYTYIDDIIDGVVAAVDSQIDAAVINLGNSTPVRLVEMIETIAREAGCEAVIESLPDQPGDVPATCADISRAHEMLGYEPRIPFNEGIKRFVAWYKQARSEGPAE